MRENHNDDMEHKDKTHQSFKKIELAFERILFGARWMMAPIYAGLIGGLCVVLIKFIQLLILLLWHCLHMDFDDIAIQVLDLIDLSLLGNLLLIVTFAGYENYVSRLDLKDHTDYPQWMGHVTFGDIKIKLMASIVAMSAIHLLADFLRVDEISTHVLLWSVVIHLSFVASAILLAIMDHFAENPSHSPEEQKEKE